MRENVIGLIRRQEERLALRLLAWQYQKMKLPLPVPEELHRQAGKLVDDAHRIARERGRNVVSILKEMISDYLK